MAEWSEEFRAEIRERHLRQIRIYVIVAAAMTPLATPAYYYLVMVRGLFGIGGIYDWVVLFSFVYFFMAYFVFYLLIKKSPWLRLTSQLILLWDAIFITAFTYLLGAPHFTFIMVFPMMVMIYSVIIHPIAATRFFVFSMCLLGLVTLLTVQGVLPFFPVLREDSEIYSPLMDSVFSSGQKELLASIGYFTALILTFITLVTSNYLVRRLRRREDDLTRSYKEVRDKADQVTRLSDQLRVYLPRQFVDSLARGDMDSGSSRRRKRLTIFFSDVRGFTALTDKHEPEEVHELLNRYLSEMSRLADKWGGTIDKFIGDAIMIFFGDPEFKSDRDHALRCVRMSMEMQERMAELRKEWEDRGYVEPLHVRIGIHTGWVTVGNFGSEDRLNYTALGSAVNLAARLESASESDRITISHTTWSLIKDEISCQARGELEVKGFSEPVKIYEVKWLEQTNQSE